MRRCCTCGKIPQDSLSVSEKMDATSLKALWWKKCIVDCAAFLCVFASVLQAGWRGCHMNLAAARQPCLETRWYRLEIMSVKERVKRCTHALIFCTLKRRLGLAERSCYSIRVWTSANGRREELEIMHVGTQLSVCAPPYCLWSLQYHVRRRQMTSDCQRVWGKGLSL